MPRSKDAAQRKTDNETENAPVAGTPTLTDMAFPICGIARVHRSTTNMPLGGIWAAFQHAQ
jgi:hypothetical protein